MNAALTATFELLAKTKNEAAVPVLTAALDSSSRDVQLGAVRAILQRRCPTGLRALRLERLAATGEAVPVEVPPLPLKLDGVVYTSVFNPGDGRLPTRP